MLHWCLEDSVPAHIRRLRYFSFLTEYGHVPTLPLLRFRFNSILIFITSAQESPINVHNKFLYLIEQDRAVTNKNNMVQYWLEGGVACQDPKVQLFLNMTENGACPYFACFGISFHFNTYLDSTCP